MSSRLCVVDSLLSLHGKLKKLFALRRCEWRLLLAAAILLPAIGGALRIFGYRRTQAWIGRSVHKSRHSTGKACEVAQVCRMVSVAACHGLYQATCLRQALVAWWLLGRIGIVSKLVIGVRNDKHGFSAHAWVEYQGRVVIGGDDAPQRFHSMTPPIWTRADELSQNRSIENNRERNSRNFPS